MSARVSTPMSQEVMNTAYKTGRPNHQEIGGKLGMKKVRDDIGNDDQCIPDPQLRCLRTAQELAGQRFFQRLQSSAPRQRH